MLVIKHLAIAIATGDIDAVGLYGLSYITVLVLNSMMIIML